MVRASHRPLRVMCERVLAIASSCQMGQRRVKKGKEEGPVCVEYMIVDVRGVAFNLDVDSWIAGRGILESGGRWEAGVQGSVPVGAFDRVHGSTVWVSALRGDAGRGDIEFASDVSCNGGHQSWMGSVVL